MHTYRLTRNVCMHIIIDTFSPMPMGRASFGYSAAPVAAAAAAASTAENCIHRGILTAQS